MVTKLAEIQAVHLSGVSEQRCLLHKPSQAKVIYTSSENFFIKILCAFFFGVCFHSVELDRHDEEVLSICAAKGENLGVVCVRGGVCVRNPGGGKYKYIIRPNLKIFIYISI